MHLTEIGFELLIFQMRVRFEKQKKTILDYIVIIVKVLRNSVFILITYKNCRFTMELEER